MYSHANILLLEVFSSSYVTITLIHCRKSSLKKCPQDSSTLTFLACLQVCAGSLDLPSVITTPTLGLFWSSPLPEVNIFWLISWIAPAVLVVPLVYGSVMAFRMSSLLLKSLRWNRMNGLLAKVSSPTLVPPLMFNPKIKSWNVKRRHLHYVCCIYIKKIFKINKIENVCKNWSVQTIEIAIKWYPCKLNNQRDSN